MEHFADYGFNKSHSAAYALVAYQTAYLKAHYPREFMAALLSSVMGTNDKIGFYIEECRRMGINILPPDINASSSSFSVDGKAIRFGLAAIKNVGENAIANLVAIREKNGRFKSLLDFCARVDMRLVNKRVMESLIKCGAFDSLKARRSQMLAVLERTVDVAAKRQRDMASGQLGLFGDDTMVAADDIILPDMPEMPAEQMLAYEKEITGFYVTGHPLDKYRDKMKDFHSIEEMLSGGFPDGKRVRAAGLIVSLKRITTKAGDMMCFLNLEDFTNQMEVIIFPRLYEKYGRLLMPDAAIAAVGRLNVNEDAVKLIADEIKPLETVGTEVRIRIRREQETPEVFTKLKAAFAAHRGQTTVFLQLVDSRRLIKTEPKFWIDPTPAAIEALQGIVGTGAVQVVHS
jgi:DNA polymerase-3 subunit alpha